mmetsp:Transcript_22808/g.33802  ORF Transcript_22808/g.33802 Transcript_22808/m.33802 type:complete len:452 (-) Transcript_22808:159-1514(-)
MKSTYLDEEVQLIRNKTSENLNIPRLIDRDQPFHQSKSNVAVHNRIKNRVNIFPRSLRFIINENWFHLLLRWPTWLSLISLLFLWFLWLVIFAYIYVYVDQREPLLECGLGTSGEPIKFAPALSFSLETCTTVGYSLPNDTNGFFDAECYNIQVAIYMQMTWSMIFNAFFTAFLFARLSRCEQRSAQVMFSNKAIIEKKDGKWLLHVRVYDIDSQLPLVEMHIRMYCASWLKYENTQQGQPHLLHSMRIFDPTDDFGSFMFTGVPMNASHHIDAYSPLTPEHLKKDLNHLNGHGLMLRELDQLAGNSGGVPCPVCGEAYETVEQLETHIKFNKILEDADKNVPLQGTHRDPNIVKLNLTKKLELTEEVIVEHLKDKEIICVVEGIEPMISGTFQSLHSYKLEDIVFESKFTPCVCKENGKIFVDLDNFHSVEKISTLNRSDDEYRSFGETS